MQSMVIADVKIHLIKINVREGAQNLLISLYDPYNFFTQRP